MPSWLQAWLLQLLLISQTPLETLDRNLLNHHHPRHSDNYDGSPNNEKTRKEVITVENGAVAADNAQCSRIGREALLHGGNAVDATVATTLCLGVVSPASSGIGGGAFMLVRLADGTTKAFDFREAAPSKAFKDMYEGDATKKKEGALSVAVPGEVAGLYKAWKMYGKLPWKRLVFPAEKLARWGFRVSPYLYTQMNASKVSIFKDEGLRSVFTSNGKLLQPGELVVNEKLATTLRILAESDVKGFYEGPIAEGLVEDIGRLGGIITLEDLKNYQVKVRDPMVTHFDDLGIDVVGMPPPSSGGAAMVLILNILKLYGFPEGISGTLGVHRFIEAIKNAFAVRMHLGDPDFEPNVAEVIKDMLSSEFAAKLKANINDDHTFDPSHYGGKWSTSSVLVDRGTSHLSVVDKDRNAVSMTTSINAYFGSKILSTSTGIILNNQMDDFSIPDEDSTTEFLPFSILNFAQPPESPAPTPDEPPESPPPSTPANFVKPGKRPLSSMSPTIILKDGKLEGVVGASGGGLIVSGTTQVLLNYFVKGMDPFSSVHAPRVYDTLFPNKVRFENWTTVSGDHIEVEEYVRAALKRKHHKLEALTGGGAVSQFIKVGRAKQDDNRDELVAVSDPRKGGAPAGY